MVANTGSGLGGTGIIGEVTGFGSIFVNGEEVELDARTQLYLDGKKVSQHEIARGEVVAVRASVGKEMLFADEVHIQHQVIGTVQQVMAERNLFTVLGQTIEADAQSLPLAGQTVRISGFRDSDGVIHASYIDSIETTQQLLTGELKRDNRQWRIGAQLIRLPADSKPRPGQYVRVSGDLNKDVLQVTEFTQLDSLPFKQPVQRLLLQGYVRSVGDTAYRIAGKLFIVKADMQQAGLSQQVNRTQRVELRLENNAWQMSRQLDSRQLPLGRPMRGPQRMPNTPRPDMPVMRDNIPMPRGFMF
jgi:hypothetical protein